MSVDESQHPQLWKWLLRERGFAVWNLSGCNPIGSSADPHDVLQTDLKRAMFPMWRHHSHTTLLSVSHLSHTHTDTLSPVFPFHLLSSLKHVYQGSTTSWRANSFLKADLQANKNIWKRTQDASVFVFTFCFCFPPPSLTCALVDHVECTSVWWKVASASCCVPF